MAVACNIALPPHTRLNSEDEEALVLQHLPLVRSIARAVHRRLPRQVEIEDLISAGVFGLLDSIRKYHPGRAASLATYAQFRIRGAILDSLRSQDWGSRRLRQMARSVEQARHDLRAALGHVPSDAELADALKIPLAQLQVRLAEVHALQIAAFSPQPEDETAIAPAELSAPGPTALQTFLAAERGERIARALETLPPREAQVVRLYYFDELSMKEAGKVMGVTESRICQLHATALRRLKRKLASVAV